MTPDGKQLIDKLSGIALRFTPYAFDRPVFIPGFGIIARNEQSLIDAIDDDFLRSCGIQP